jgi:DNA-binding LacI/PurR family transcriptional regulator
MTVSRVLTGRGYVAHETARRVRAASSRLQYRPNPTARLLRGRQSHLVGVTIPSLSSAIHRGIVTGLEELLGPAGYQLLLGHLQSGARHASSFLASVERQHCDGYVIVPSRADATNTVAVRLGRPAVVALAEIPGLTTDRVLADGCDAARTATRFLAERFGDPVAYVNLDSRLSHDMSMLEGYLHALRDTGGEECLLLVPPGDDACRTVVRAALAAARPPQAFLFASSLVVLEGLAALVQSGRHIGRDVGVVTAATEERPWTGLLPAMPPLLVIPAREIGRRAGMLLLRQLRAEASPSPQVEVVPVEFRV